MRVKTAALTLCVLLGAVSAPGLADAARQGGQTQGQQATQQRQPATAARQTTQPAGTGTVWRTYTSRGGNVGHFRPAVQTAATSGQAAFRPISSSGFSFRSGGYGGISCVPYARWWHNAAGLYARGNRREAGSVLVFRATGSMHSGHVAVVRRSLGARHVMIDHANWAGPGIRKGTVMQNVSVVDVSPDNDWTSVRVQIGHDGGSFGREYPTYGFIYNRQDNGSMIAAAPAPRISRPTEVAEAPLRSSRPLRLTADDLNELSALRAAAGR